MVKTGELKLLIGTDAASEGLNLQRLGTLINIDLPWNPTRLEQRKGRIQRIGQIPDVLSSVWVDLALEEEARVDALLDTLPKLHAFDERYSRIQARPGWDDCSRVLNRHEKIEELRKGWRSR